MKAILCERWGGPETLRIGTVPIPQPSRDELLVGPQAWAANFADLVLIGGSYHLKPTLPFVPGMEIAGRVVSVGDAVSAFKPGDRVACYVESGGFAEYVVARPDATMLLPEGMPYETGAAFPATYGTAHIALTHRARVERGESLLVLGAAGGVGLAAVELGKLLGASVIAAASSAEKLQVAAEHGADHVVNYAVDPLVQRVKALTNGRGVDVIFDPVGGDRFDDALRCLAFEGRLVVIGFASGRIPTASAGRLLIKSTGVMGSSWTFSLKQRPALVRKAFEDLSSWYASGALRPRIHAVMPFEKAADALRLLSQRTVSGKIVLTKRT